MGAEEVKREDDVAVAEETPPPEAPTEVPASDTFDGAFEEATTEKKPEGDKPGPDADLDAIAPVVPDAPEAPPAAPPEPPPEKTWEQKETEYQDRIKALEAAGSRPQDATPPPKSDPPPEPKASLTEEEKVGLETYEEEYADVSKFEGIKRKAELESVKADFARQLAELTSSLAPVMSVAAEYSRAKFEEAIVAQHGDFYDLRDKGLLKGWIEKQPEALKEQYAEWYKNGTKGQIIALIGLYKDTQPKEPPPLKPSKTPSVTLVKKGPVNPTHVPAKDDFEGAFDEAIRGA